MFTLFDSELVADYRRVVPRYDTVAQALDALRDPQTLAEVASAMLLDELPELVMGATTADLGRDGKVKRGVWGEEWVVVQFSLEANWRRNWIAWAIRAGPIAPNTDDLRDASDCD